MKKKLFFIFLFIFLYILFIGSKTSTLAATYQNTASFETIVGKPSTAASVEILVNAIQAACPNGYVTNVCISGLTLNNIPLTSQVTQLLDTSNGPLQCGLFVEAVLAYIGQPSLPDVDWAIHWSINPGNNYQFVWKNPSSILPLQQGDMPVWRSDTFGHVGYITEVSSDSTVFRVAEANFVSGVVDLRTFSQTNGPLTLLGVLRIK